MEALDPGDAESLIVSSNWLMWQRLANEGRHCIHVSAGLLGWPDAVTLGVDHFVRTNDWYLRNGRDLTLFRGVSLGRRFVRAVSLFLTDWQQLSRCLETLIRRYGPEEIVLYDLRTDFHGLDEDGRANLVAAVARSFGVRAVDRFDPPSDTDPDISVDQHYDIHQGEQPRWRDRARDLLRTAFAATLGHVSRLRRAANGGRPAVLLLDSHLTGIPLIEALDGRGPYAAILAGWFPRKGDLRFLSDALRKGVLLLHCPSPDLRDDDRAAVMAIEHDLDSAWRSPASDEEREVLRFVRHHVVDSGRLYDAAREVLWANRLLDRYRPNAILTDGPQLPLITTCLSLAKARGLPTAIMWHGHYIQDTKLETLGGDSRLPTLVDWFLTWGRSNEDWLHGTSARVRPARVGNPVAVWPDPIAETGSAGRTALVLQYANNNTDLASPGAHEYMVFVETVRMLQDLGVSEIRLKLHPGSKKTRYYRAIAEYFDLDCRIFDQGPFKDFVAWADLIVGPPFTGAMFEVLGAGKPYYPVLLPPHSVNPDYLAGGTVYSDLETLRQDLERGVVPDQSRLLDDFASLEEFPDPAARIWEVLETQVLASHSMSESRSP